MSAAAVAAALHLAIRDAWAGAILLMLCLGVGVPQLRARRRLKALLSSGDLNAILEAWNEALDRLPDSATAGPLVRATAFAAHGFPERARAVLERTERGAAWDNALEHRLFLETLLDSFDGRVKLALAKAGALTQLPLPASPWARGRSATLRNGAAALARAFAHKSQPADAAHLAAAAKHHPLVHWAMRYAQAIVHVDRGEEPRALALLQGAPEWPEGSLFRDYHAELLSVAGGDTDD